MKKILTLLAVIFVVLMSSFLFTKFDQDDVSNPEEDLSATQKTEEKVNTGEIEIRIPNSDFVFYGSNLLRDLKFTERNLAENDTDKVFAINSDKLIAYGDGCVRDDALGLLLIADSPDATEVGEVIYQGEQYVFYIGPHDSCTDDEEGSELFSDLYGELRKGFESLELEA